MPQYEVTTTVSFTCVHTVDADGEETAKEQAETLTRGWIARNGCNPFAPHDMEQEAVQYITRDEDYKLHT